MAGDLLDDPSISLVDEQVRNGVPIRMALLYLLAAVLPEEAGLREPGVKEA
jgi:aspartate carbamoyltransferase catalytic subunit